MIHFYIIAFRNANGLRGGKIMAATKTPQDAQYTLNFDKGLSFPPPEYIEAIERHNPGFVSTVMEKWREELELSRRIKQKKMDDGCVYNKFEMKFEKRRAWFSIIAMYSVLFVMLLSAIAGIIMFFECNKMGAAADSSSLKDSIAKGAICLGVSVMLALAIVFNNIKSPSRRP